MEEKDKEIIRDWEKDVHTRPLSAVKESVGIFGRKLFFIAPDPKFITKELVLDLCSLGYLSYIIPNDDACPLRKKVETIIETFPNSIIYLNIDLEVPGLDWKSFIRGLQEKYSETALIGVFYLESGREGEQEEITSYYVKNIGISAGCIALRKESKFNFPVIKRVIEQSGARGRRTLIRTDCDKNSHVDFNFGGRLYTGQVIDVNVECFKCQFPSGDILKIFDKVRGAKLVLNGHHFSTDAVLIMKREKENEHISVFMFIHDEPNDLPGLEKSLQTMLNSKIYQNEYEKASRLLKEKYSKRY